MNIRFLVALLVLSAAVGCKREAAEKGREEVVAERLRDPNFKQVTVAEARAEQAHAGHGHHATHSKHHADPGPRALSLQARLTERAEAQKAISWPDPADGLIQVGVRPHGVPYSVFRIEQDGKTHLTEYEGMGHDERRIRPDVISVLDLVTRRPDLRVVHATADHAQHHHCAYALWERKPETRSIRLEWRMLIHYTAARLPGGKRHLVIDDVENVQVPTEADREVIDCYTAMFRGNEVFDDWPTSPADLALADNEQATFTWPVCIHGDQMSAVTTAANNN